MAPRDVESVRVAGVTPSARLTAELRDSMAKLQRAGEADDASLAASHALANRINEDLLARTHAEARAGSEVIVWSEHAAAVTPETQPLLVEKARSIAGDLGVTIVMGVGVWRRGERPSFENKAVIVSADGRHEGDYFKAKPIVGRESGRIPRGDSDLHVFESVDDRFALVICHDLDFPEFVREAGRERVMALLAPSADWDAITPLHARMAVARAVENGCSLVRPCEDGLSLAVDPLGRTLASQRDLGPDGNVMVCHVPRFRLRAAYPRVGDAFGWLSALGLLVLLVSARRARTAPE
jgi:apolipoprotein N-acyltransferase